MRILVACEESQAVTIELRKLGHEAYSCDIVECSGGHPEWHLMQDVREVLTEKWDMIIAFPPCTYLTAAGTRHYSRRINSEEKVLAREAEREKAVEFFMLFVNANCDKIAIENPVGHMNTKYRKPNQIINPYQFGDPFEKKTCIWLKGLPALIPTNIVEPPPRQILSSGKTMPFWYSNCGGNRAKARSKTFTGIAKAMAEQWG
jgi:site-specific DNA-cytosine methylase